MREHGKKRQISQTKMQVPSTKLPIRPSQIIQERSGFESQISIQENYWKAQSSQFYQWNAANNSYEDDLGRKKYSEIQQ